MRNFYILFTCIKVKEESHVIKCDIKFYFRSYRKILEAINFYIMCQVFLLN